MGPEVEPRQPETLSPVRDNFDQAFHSGIIACTRIAPVQRIVDVSPAQRIMVHVLQFLQHHFVVLQLLWPTAFLPQLMDLVDLVAQLEEPHFLEQGCKASLLHGIDQLSCGK